MPDALHRHHAPLLLRRRPKPVIRPRDDAVAVIVPSPPRPAAAERRPGRVALPLVTLLLFVTSAITPRRAVAATPAPDFATFARDDSPAIRERIDVDDREYRRIEPTLWHLADVHAAALARLGPGDRADTLADLAGFVLRMRDKHADDVVLGEGRSVIGLLDPDRGLDPREITTIAGAYGARATVWKQGAGSPTGPATKQATAEGFIEAIHEAARSAEPTTVVVLGHGLPDEIQSYSIPCDHLAAALLGGAARRPGTDGKGPAEIDLSAIVLVCDDCFSADFLENLGAAIEKGCARRGIRLAALPACVAGTNRDRYGIADVGEKFVPHFWKDVIELFYVRLPRPEAVTLGDFFEKVDNMMYGYGRAPIVRGGAVVGYRLVDPSLCQDPAFFVPLSAAEAAELAAILGLESADEAPRFLDIG